MIWWPGYCPGHGVGLEGDEAVDEERRQDPQQLPVEGGRQCPGQLHSPHILQNGVPGGLQVRLYGGRAGQVEELLCPREDDPDDQCPRQRFPAFPEGGEQARVDAGETSHIPPSR